MKDFAQANVENYKAGLVPIVYTWNNEGVDKYTNDEHYIDAMPIHIKLTPLYALKETDIKPHDMPAPYDNCQFKHCDLRGQCLGEGKCHHTIEKDN